MIRLGEEEPAFCEQADVHDDKGGEQHSGAFVVHADPEQDERDGADQSHEDPFHVFHEGEAQVMMGSGLALPHEF